MNTIYALLGAFAFVGAAFGVYAIWRGGRKAERADQAERAVEVQGKQLDAAARPPAGRGALLGRMQDGDL